MKGKDGVARAIYVTATGERVVVVHVFVKKTQKTPQDALDVAAQDHIGAEVSFEEGTREASCLTVAASRRTPGTLVAGDLPSRRLPRRASSRRAAGGRAD